MGHWFPGAADFLGEEQEQVNAIIGRRAVTTKHMSQNSTLYSRIYFFFVYSHFLLNLDRRDDISGSFFYHNGEKNAKMPQYLVKCYRVVMIIFII